MAFQRSLCVLVGLLLSWTLVACSGSSGTDPETPPGVARVAVTTGSTRTVADGTSRTRVEAKVTNFAGAPLPGAEVEFHTTLGALLRFEDERALLGEEATRGQATTNASGVALAYLESPTRLGTGRLVAVSGGVDGEGSVEFVAGSAKTVIVRAVPPNLSADGASKATVTVWVLDEHDNAIDTRVTVRAPSVGFVSKPVVDTKAGTGTFDYTAGTTAGDVPLRVATEDGLEGQGNVTLISEIVGSVTLSTEKTEVVANGGATEAGGARLKVTVLGPGGASSPLVGVRPTVLTKLGGLTPDPADPGQAGPSIQAPPTDALGVTYVWLLSSSNLGSTEVWAAAGGVSSTTRTIDFVGGPPDTILLQANPASVVANGTSTVKFTAVVYDEWGNPTDTDLTIAWPSQGRVDDVLVSTGASTESTGMASFTYTAGSTPGDVTIRVTASNGVVGEKVVTLRAP